ncbi:helix-turn-helix domain-containing protein [Fimbriimonas ginsengisoli]|nr:helix-turn-helix domain-containing protein [Fimbriimonas ginsengisoli]
MTGDSRSKISLVTHPVRARVLLTLMRRELTTQEMADLLPDVSKTSLYRHIRELAEAGVIKVVGETAIRGTVEKRFAVQSNAVTFSNEDLLDAGHEEYLRLISGLLESVLAVVQGYLARKEPTLAEDTLFRVNAANLTDEEFWALRKQLTDLLSSARDNPAAPGRRRRVISLLAVPDEGPVSKEEAEK